MSAHTKPVARRTSRKILGLPVPIVAAIVTLGTGVAAAAALLLIHLGITQIGNGLHAERQHNLVAAWSDVSNPGPIGVFGGQLSSCPTVTANHGVLTIDTTNITTGLNTGEGCGFALMVDVQGTDYPATLAGLSGSLGATGWSAEITNMNSNQLNATMTAGQSVQSAWMTTCGTTFNANQQRVPVFLTLTNVSAVPGSTVNLAGVSVDVSGDGTSHCAPLTN